MKHLILFLVLVYIGILGNCSAYANQIDFTKIKSKIDEYVNKVEIDRKQYDTKKTKILEGSSEGGQIQGYYKPGDNQDVDPRLMYFIASFAGDSGMALHSCYFVDNSITYLVVKTLLYDRPFYMEGFKVVDEKIQEFFIHNNKTIYLLDNEYQKIEVYTERNYKDFVNEMVTALRKSK